MTSQRPPRPAARGLLAAALVLLALAGCADTQGIRPQARLTDAAALGLPAGQDLAPAPDWWRALGDEQLDSLVLQALEGNPNLRVAAARVAKARAGELAARAASLPQVGGAADLNRQSFSSHYIYPPPLGGTVQTLANLQLNGGWELDFFGKHAGALDAAIGQTRAAQAQADAARVLLAANVVRAYVQWAHVNELHQLAERTLAQRQQMTQLVQQRTQAGLDNQVSLRQNESSRADTRTSLAALAQQQQAARQALAALLGQPRLADAVAAPRLAQLKTLAVPAELHADWLARRADISAARWRVEAARGEVQVARAQFYPNINLAGFLGFQSLGFDNLLKGGSFQWGVGPALRLPIFEAGKLRAHLSASSAEVDAAIESYNAAVIDAVREAHDQAHAVQSLARQQAEQAQAQAAAEAAWDLARQRYQAGLGTYLQVLGAETAVLAQRRQQLDLAAQVLGAQIGLTQAMGGGWQPSATVSSPGTTTVSVAPH